MNRCDTLRQALSLSGVSQSELSRRTGVAQSRISDYANHRIEPSEASFDKLMAALGMVAQVSVGPAGMERTKLRSWMLHSLIAKKTKLALDESEWQLMRDNIQRLRKVTFGQLFEDCLNRWAEVVDRRDRRELGRILVDVSQDGITMREVSPMTGFLTEEERSGVLSQLRRVAP